MISPLVSVVVPSYRRPYLLEKCLQALLAQNFPPHAFEIIVVDDDPQGTMTRQAVTRLQLRLEQQNQRANQLLATVSAKTPLGDRQADLLARPACLPCQSPRLVYQQSMRNCGPAAARNLGWQNAAGKIIAFTDDDCLPHPDWLSNGVSAFQPDTAGVSGRMIVPVSANPTDNELNMTGLERSDFVTANCFYRRSILEEIGGFDERFRVAWREDSDLYFTLRKNQLPLAWAPDAIVHHPVRLERWGSSLRQQRKSFYNALLYKKHPHLYRQFIQKAPPWRYYAILSALAVGLLGTVARQSWLAVPGFAAWAVLVGSFILQRLRKTNHSPGHVLEMVLTSLLIPFLSVYWRLRGAIHWRVLFL